MSSSSSCTRIGFWSSFYPTRIVKDKAWIIWVRYFVVDHAHPTLEFGYWENICTRQFTNLQATLDEFWLVLYSTRLLIKYIRERGAHTTRRPSWSRISGMTPSSLPVIFSRMVVFPAFRRPIISTRNRLHNRLRSSGEVSMLVSYTKQKSRSKMQVAEQRGSVIWVGDEDEGAISKPYHLGQTIIFICISILYMRS